MRLRAGLVQLIGGGCPGACLIGALALFFVAGCATGGAFLDCQTTSEDCPAGYECDPQTRRCVLQMVGEGACMTAADCNFSDRPLCSGYRCVPCDSVGPVDKADAACRATEQMGAVACLRSGERKGQCAECRLSTQCTDKARPACEAATGNCRPCQRNSDCIESFLCKTVTGAGAAAPVVVDFPDVQTGECVPKDRVTFVDPTACPPGGVGADGSTARPFCEIQAAVDKSKTGYVVVRARPSGAYGAVSFPVGKRTVLVGPGRESMTTAPILGATASGAGTVAVITDATLRGDPAGLGCSGGARVTLLRSQIQQSTIGIDATGCDHLTVEASAITQSRGTGLRIGAGTKGYRIVNSLLSGNGQSAMAPTGSSAVSVAAGVVGTFALNTVINNGSIGQDGGAVSCETTTPPNPPAPLVTISDSLVVQNSRSLRTDGMGSPIGTQFRGGCRLARVVVGVDAVPAAAPNEQVLRAIPDLDQALHLLDTPNNRAICVDKGQPVEGVTLDYFGSERPRGQGFDLGAHELR